MLAEKVVYALLSADATLASLVGSRIYPVVLPQDKTLPALTYEVISANEREVIDAASTYAVVDTHIQITGLASTYAGCKAIMEAARSALLYFAGTIEGVYVPIILRGPVGPDQFDAKLYVYMQSADYYVSHFEPQNT